MFANKLKKMEKYYKNCMKCLKPNCCIEDNLSLYNNPDFVMTTARLEYERDSYRRYGLNPCFDYDHSDHILTFNTVFGHFIFCDVNFEIDYYEFIDCVCEYDYNGGKRYNFSIFYGCPSDVQVYQFLSKLKWQHIKRRATFYLPYRFNKMFEGVDILDPRSIVRQLLILAGDIETNPGPVQSRPLSVRNNDPRMTKLEKALERKQDKIETLIKELRRSIKDERIYPQSLFKSLQNVPELSTNLTRICDFLESNLPLIQQSVQTSVVGLGETFTNIKNDLIKIILVCIIIRLLMSLKYQKTALVVVLLFTLKFFEFDQTIIELVDELKAKMVTPQNFPDMEDIIYHPYYQVCGKIIFAVLAFICIKKIPGRADWDNYITRLDRIPKAIDGSKKIVDYCSEYFNLATDQVKILVLGKTSEELVRANGLYNEIKEWAKEVRSYIDLDQRNKIDTDVTIANKVEDLYKRGLKYQQDTLLDRDIAKLVSVTLLPARELYQYVSCSPIKGGGPKMRPICVWLVGESGTGKTELVYPLCIDVLRAMGLMKKEDFHHQVYGRQVETEFWDGYKGQKIVIYDDAFQKKDDKTAPNPEIFEVIRSCNTFPQHLHMAALHDKNTFSAAELLLYTTNDANVKLESITFPDAFYNRMGEHAYKVRPKLKYSTLVQRGKSGQTYRKLLKSTLSKEVPIDLDIYEFQKIIRDEGNDSVWTEVGEPIDYNTFAKLICDEWFEKKNTSVKKLKFLENYAIRAQVFPEQYTNEWFVNDIAKQINIGKDLTDIENEYLNNDDVFEAYLEFKKFRPTSIWDKYRTRIDECIINVNKYLNRMQEKIVEVVRAHPYLSILGFVGLALSAFAMYKWFAGTFEDENSNPLKQEKKLIYDFELERYFTPDEIEKFDKLRDEGLNTKEIDKLMGDNVLWKRYARWSKPEGGRMVEVNHSGDSKTNRLQQKRVEVGSSGDVKTNKMQQKRVEVGNEKRVSLLDDQLKEKIQVQGCNDLAAHSLITDVLQKNTYRMSYFKNGIRKPFGNCTFIRGWVFLMPYHFLEALFARKLAPETIICFSQSKYADIIQVPLSHFILIGVDKFALSSNCAQLVHKSGETRDCVIVNLHRRMCHPHRDLVKHFVKIEDQGKLQGQFNGTLATFHEDNKELYRTYQWLQAIRSVDKPITIYLPDDGYVYPQESYKQRDCYVYNAPTQVGDCGSIIGLYNHRMERKLIGLHIAGTNESFGYACPLTQEAIDDACEKLLGKDFRNISTQFYYEIPKGINSMLQPNIPEGLFCPLGVSDKEVGQAVKTSILPSCIQGKLSVPFTRPALLKPTFINGVLHDPLLKGLKKCGVETAILTDDEVSSAAQDVGQVVLTKYNTMLDKRKYQKFLSYEEAIRGTGDDDFMGPISRKTSPGFPYNLDTKGFPGKTKWMGKNENFDFDSPDAKALKQDVLELIKDCKNGKISNVIFIDTLKDEKRENFKVDAGKTRVFSAGPQHFVVAFRIYFLPFSAWLMHNRIDNEIAVGSNPYSLDWERIAKRLKSKGDKVIAGDFGNFDGSLVAQVLWSIFWDIYVPWLQQFNDLKSNEGKETLKICLGLWTHLVHSVHIFKDNVYMWTHSQPSGNPFTVIINCLYNSIIMRIAWMRIMEQKFPKYKSMKWFRHFVAMVAYGDDNELNIANEVIDLYNQETISEVMKEMRHEYTDEGKTGNVVKYRLLEDTFFLKRGFRYSAELCRTVAPLKKEVIYEMLNWTRNTIDPNVILMDNIDTAFREIVYHGREEYNNLRDKILKIVDDLPNVPQILTYEQYLHDIEHLADEIYDF